MPTANHTISSNRSRQRSKASLLAPDSPHRSKALGELQTPNTRTQEGMPSTPSLRSRGRAAHLSPFPASRRPDLVHFHGGTPSPGAAGVAAANGAGRRSDPPAALPAEPQREAGEALPGPGAARRRAESPLLHGPKTRGAGAGEAGSAQSASGRSTAVATAPPASPWRASNATFPGAEGSGPPNLLAPPGFPGPAGPGAPTPTPTPRAGPGRAARLIPSPRRPGAHPRGPAGAQRPARAEPGGLAPPATAPASPRAPLPAREGGQPAAPEGGEGGSPCGGGEVTQAPFLLHRRFTTRGSPGLSGRTFPLRAVGKSSGLASLNAAEQRWWRDSQPCLSGLPRRRHLGRHFARGAGGGPQRTDTHRYLVTSVQPCPSAPRKRRLPRAT